VKYRIIDPRYGERIECDTFAEMLNMWFLRPSLVMTTVGLTSEETQAVANLMGLNDRLKSARRELESLRKVSTARGSALRLVSNEEGVVL
jgi:hypothetical protein